MTEKNKLKKKGGGLIQHLVFSLIPQHCSVSGKTLYFMKKINKLNCYEARDIGHQLNEQQNPLTGFNNSWPIFWTYSHLRK